MILSFADRDTADLFSGKKVRRFAHLTTVAERKLQQLDSAMMSMIMFNDGNLPRFDQAA